MPADCRAHMSTCKDCQRAWEAEKRLQAGLNDWKWKHEFPSDWNARLRQRIAAARRPAWREWLDNLRENSSAQRLRLAAAALLLLIAAGAGVYLRPRLWPSENAKPASHGVVRDLQALNRYSATLQCPLFEAQTIQPQPGAGEVN